MRRKEHAASFALAASSGNQHLAPRSDAPLLLLLLTQAHNTGEHPFAEGRGKLKHTLLRPVTRLHACAHCARCHVVTQPLYKFVSTVNSPQDPHDLMRPKSHAS